MRLDLDVDQVTEADGERAVGLVPFGRCLFDAGHLADERAQHRRRPTELAAQHTAQRASLLLGSRHCRAPRRASIHHRT